MVAGSRMLEPGSGVNCGGVWWSEWTLGVWWSVVERVDGRASGWKGGRVDDGAYTFVWRAHRPSNPTIVLLAVRANSSEEDNFLLIVVTGGSLRNRDRLIALA